MNIFRSFSLMVISGFLFLSIGCFSKDPIAVSTPVEEYYKGQQPVEIKAIASDWDQVISNKDKWAQNWGYLKLIKPNRLWSALKLWARADVRDDIKKAKKHSLIDENGNPIKIYGAGNYIDYFAQKYDPSLAEIRQPLVEVLASVKPIKSTIALYQELGLPVVVWTNNDHESYNAKLANLNQQIQPQFSPVAGFAVEQDEAKSSEASSLTGKPTADYYTKAYEYTKNKLNLGDKDTVVFVDDMAENIDAARQVAKEQNLPIVAIQYTTPEQLKNDFALLARPAGQVASEMAPGFIEPKELDGYLFNRDQRVAE